jgi:predicted esterase
VNDLLTHLSPKSIVAAVLLSVCLALGVPGTAQATTKSECMVDTFELAMDTYSADFTAKGWWAKLYPWWATMPLIGVYVGLNHGDEDYSQEQELIGKYQTRIERYTNRGILAAGDSVDLLADSGALEQCIADIGNDDAGLTGLYALESSDLEREYYLSVPDNYDPDAEALPLLIMIHGSGDSIDGWFEGGFQGEGLLNLARQDAIVVIPNGLEGNDGRRNWDATTERDYDFFLDLLAELDLQVTYDYRRIFVTGHSAGALMTHGLGCHLGDIFRAIAPSAGSLTDLEFSCDGSVAVMQIQGEFDEIQTLEVVTQTRDDWAQYNGYNKFVFADTEPAPCVDYSSNSLLYPMQWCLHDMTESQGHAWWDQADQAIWNFFRGLEIVEPSLDPPPNGGNDKVIRTEPNYDATIAFTINYPEGVGEPVRTGLFYYPAGSQLPISGAPLNIANGDVYLGDVSAGTRTVIIPVDLPSASQLPETYTLVLAMYIFGSFPIPVAGIDHNLIYEVTIQDETTDIIIPGVQPMLPVQE